MAEQQEDRSPEDLSEEISPYRLEEQRKKGQVSQSRELSALAALLAAGVTAYLMAPSMQGQLTEFMQEVFRTDLSARANLGDASVAKVLFMKALYIIGAIGLPVSIAGFIAGAAASFTQVGSIFSFDPISPNFEKVNPLSGIKKLVSKRVAMDGLRLIFKTLTVLLIAYVVLKTEILNSPAQVGQAPVTVLAAFARSAKIIFLALISVLFVFAAIDFAMQRHEYNKGLRMTKQEAKQEAKERDGDPQIKARIRSVQREMARRRMMQAVKKAHVIITNPTHIAIAVVYEKDKMAAPRVVAKGADFLAQRIKKVAADAGIPLVENVPLART
ncbi:MAG: hypothetical protein A2Z97_12525, partial [Bdellovibrionales bacterium GWB1_52_6]